MGPVIQRGGDTVKRLLQPAEESFAQLEYIAKFMFSWQRTLYFSIDDTLLKKIYSRLMQGTGPFFDTKTGRCITAFRLCIGLISDGRYAIPIACSYLFAKEILDAIGNHNFPSKNDIAKIFVKTAQRLFPNTKLIAVADGLYATVEFISWCKESHINMEVRMHSNRIVEYKGKKIKLKDLAHKLGIKPKGRQMVRTITAIWHKLELEISIVRRIDKHGKTTIVFQAATYKALPREHRTAYKNRWPIEKMIRTSKQNLGLQECYSTKLLIQHNHVAAVFLAYALAQLEMKKRKLKTPEAAIRRLKKESSTSLTNRFCRLDQIFGVCDA